MTVLDEGGSAAEARYGLPRLGKPAQAFEAVTTHGTVRLTDFEGSWLVLFSHPADFTPVCTTEFIGFAGIYPQLQERHTELLGLSIDSVYSHIAWLRNIEEKAGVVIPFPVIADLDRKVATAYGMVMPGESATETSRCVFAIDPRRHPAGDDLLPADHRPQHRRDPPPDRRPAGGRLAKSRHPSQLAAGRAGHRADAGYDRAGRGAGRRDGRRRVRVHRLVLVYGESLAVACVSADGTLTASGRAVLEAVQRPAPAQAVAAATGLALYRVRGALRELAAGLVTEESGRFAAAPGPPE